MFCHNAVTNYNHIIPNKAKNAEAKTKSASALIFWEVAICYSATIR